MASRSLPPPQLRLDLCSPRLPPLRSPGCRRRRRVLSALPSPSPSPTSRSKSVSTVPLERGVGSGADPRAATSRQQPRGSDPALAAEFARLSALRSRLRGARSVGDKLRALDTEPRVVEFFGEGSNGGVLGALEPREVFLLKCLVSAGQEHVLGAEFDWDGCGQEHYHHHNGGSGGSALRQALSNLAGLVGKWSSEGVVEGKAGSGEMELLQRLLKFLGDINEFYDCIGGIIGYQIMALELLSASKDHKHRSSKHKSIDFHVPSGLNLLEDTEYASQAALWGIEVTS